MNEKIELKLIIDGKEAITTLNLTDENLKKLVTGFDRVRGASTKSSLDIAAAWGSVTMGINQAMMLAERFYGIISAPIKVAGQFEAYETQLKVMLGSAEAAKQRLAELQEFAATTPFTLPQVVETGNQLQSMQQYSIETIRQLGDLAAASGKPFDQVMNAYAKLVSGQKGIAIDMFRDLLITSNDWAKATGAHFSNSGEIMAKAEDMAKALPKILKEKGFDGMMAEQAKTLNGMSSNFEDAIIKFATSLGADVLPAAKSVVGGLTDLVISITPVKSKLDEATEAGAQQRAEFDRLTGRYIVLAQNTGRTKEENELFKKTIDELQRTYPGHLKNLDLEKEKLERVKDAFKNVRDEMEKNILQRKYSAEIEDKVLERDQIQQELDKLTEKLTDLKAKKDRGEYDIRGAIIGGGASPRTITGLERMIASKQTDWDILTLQLEGLYEKIDKYKSIEKKIVESAYSGGGEYDTNQKVKKTDLNIEIFDAQKLSEFEKRLRDEKIKAIQQAEATALAIIQSSNDQEFTLRRNHAKKTITDKQQLEAALAVIDKQELERKKQLLTDQLSEIKGNTSLEKDERELKEQELLNAITTIEGQILDVKRVASDKAIDLAEREAEFRKQTMKQIVGDAGNLFGQLYGRAQEDERREIDSEKKKRTAALETERKKRLEHAVTQQEKDRINQEYDSRLQQMEDQYEQRQKEAGVEMFYMQQHIAAVQALINTYEAATKAYAQGGAIFGPPLAAMITALGLAQVAMIESQEPPGYIQGGLVDGTPGIDSNIIRVTNGEYVINPEATNRYINVLDAINNNRELKIPVSADRDSELTTEIRLLRQENRRLLSRQLKAFSRPHKIKAGIDRYETAAIVETAEPLINRSKA